MTGAVERKYGHTHIHNSTHTALRMRGEDCTQSLKASTGMIANTGISVCRVSADYCRLSTFRRPARLVDSLRLRVVLHDRLVRASVSRGARRPQCTLHSASGNGSVGYAKSQAPPPKTITLASKLPSYDRS